MNNILLKLDCMEYMVEVPDNHFDLAVVDPPYGMNLKQQKFVKPSRPNSYITKPKHFVFDDSHRPSKEYFIELMRISKNQIIWGATNLYDLLPLNDSWIFWNKINGEGSHFADGEFAYTSFSCSSKMFSCSTFDGTRGGKDRIHPTQKPVALYKWLLTNYAKPGYKLFDSHSGSGSFRIAAYDMGFDLVSCELDADYCRDNEARYQKHIQQIDLFKPEELQKNIYQRELIDE